jgi:hypothetical protein
MSGYEERNMQILYTMMQSFPTKNKVNTDQNTPVASINVRIVLNDVPPINQLAFYESPIERLCTSQNRLVGQYEHVRGETRVNGERMSWGSFYCVVSGELTGVRLTVYIFMVRLIFLNCII